MTDVGRAIMLDLFTGDPYVDPGGNMFVIEGNSMLKQTADTLLHTQMGEDILAPTYGFDIQGIMRGDYGPIKEYAVKAAVLEAFDPEKEPTFASVSHITVTQTGDYAVSVSMTLVAADSTVVNTLSTVII